MWITPSHTLTNRVLLFIAGLAGAILIASTLGVYAYSMHKQANRTQQGVSRYATLLAGRENARFEAVKNVQNDAIARMIKILANSEQTPRTVQNIDRIFDRLLPLREDGTRRSPMAYHTGVITPNSGYAEGITVYMRDGRAVSAFRKLTILVGIGVVQQQGYRLENKLKNLFFATPHGDIIFFMPGNKKAAEFYLKRASNRFEVEKTDWFTAAAPSRNPDRKGVCIDINKDRNVPLGLRNRTMCHTPVFFDGQFLGTIGTQISHSDLYPEFYEHAVPTFDVAVLSSDGFVISAPKFFQDQNINGRFRSISDFPGPLFSWLAKALGNPDSALVQNGYAAPEKADYSVGGRKIDLTNWRLLVFAKKEGIVGLALDEATTVFLVGFLGLLTFSLILAILLRLRVGAPLEQISAETQRVAKSADKDKNAAHGLLSLGQRTDEIGTLARNFEAMSQNVADVQSNLQERIDERTRAYKTEKIRAEHASQAKTKFVASMSHELRTPLNAVLGFADILRNDLPEGLSSEAVDQLDQLAHSADHLRGMVDNLLDFAQMDSGALSLKTSEVDLVKSLEDAASLTGQQRKAAHVALHLPTLNPGEVIVRADRVRVIQVLENLLSNAVKFNRPQGSIDISIMDLPGNVFRLEVRDTGNGIPKDDLDRVFEPFERLESRSAGIAGAGIGLSLSKRLITEMNGRIGVISEVGEGSIFWIELPMSTKAAAFQASDVIARTDLRVS